MFCKSKYKAIKTPCNLGHNHDSKGEAQYCNKLQFLKKIGEIKDFKNQDNVKIIVNGERITTHRVDFLVITKENRSVWHEFKGYETKDWKVKRNLMWAIYGRDKYLVKTRKDLL